MQPAVSLEKISLSYERHHALKNVSIDFPAGKFTAIIGPNGGGKTTLLKIISGLIKPGSGTVSVFGVEPLRLPPDIIGYVPQVKTLDRTFPAKAVELVASGVKHSWPGKIDTECLEKSMDALKLTGVENLAHRPLQKLSGGELQRIYMARAIVKNPKLLLLDEPVSGVDPVGEQDINTFLERMHYEREITIIVVTHDWETAYHHADFVLILNNEVICHAEPAAAFREENLRKAFGHVGHAHDMIFSLRD